jgi:hypothetical protein
MNAISPKLIALDDYGAEFVLERFGNLMARVLPEAPSAVLVGGCIRDTIYGREVKDWDFMVTSDTDACGIERALGIELEDVLGFDRSQGRAEYDQDENIYRVFETADKGINVLLVGSITGRICTFPDSISQVMFDGSQVFATKQFIETSNTKVITHSHELQRPMKDERRARLAAKYPDFTFKDIA